MDDSSSSSSLIPHLPSAHRQCKTRWVRTHADVISDVCAFVCGDEFGADHDRKMFDRKTFEDMFESLMYLTSDNALKGAGAYAYDGVEDEALRQLDALLLRRRS